MIAVDVLSNLLLQVGIVGKLHPAIVHLPIGILFLACVLHLYGRYKKRSDWESAIKFILFLSIFAIVLSIVTGLVLSDNDEYDNSLLSFHQWSAFLLLALCLLWFAALVKKKDNMQNVLSILVLVNMTVTGHYGGSLTHGSDFLSFTSDEPIIERPAITDVQGAYAYKDLVEPVFAERCFGCHGKNKQKGGLRMDSPEFLLKGGEDGKIVAPGDVNSSELYRRLMLPLNDEDHMPPKPKRPLSKKEIALIHWWINSGANFDKQVKDLRYTDTEKQLLLSFEKREPGALTPDTPSQVVAAPSSAAVQNLLEKRVAVLPVQTGSHYLQINFIGAKKLTDEDLLSLKQISKNILYLKLSDVAVTDEHLVTIGQFENLFRLHLDDTHISDTGLKHLSGLKNLRYLNLTGTNISPQGLTQLKPIASLKNLYIYNTRFTAASIGELKKNMPGVTIDTGNVSLGFIPTDTTKLR